MSICISTNRLRLIGLFLFFIQAACTQEKPTGSFTAIPPRVSLSKNESSLSMGESSLSKDEIVEMIDKIKLPVYFIHDRQNYQERKKPMKNNLPVIKQWFKQIFKGEESIHTRKVLQGRKGDITVSPLCAVVPYDADIRLIQALVSKGAEVNKKENIIGQLNLSPLGFAFVYASPHLLKWLLEKADLTISHFNEAPAAFLLSNFLQQNPDCNVQTAKLLVEKLLLANKDNLSEVDQCGNNVVHQLLQQSNNSDILMELFQGYPDAFSPCFKQQNTAGETPLYLAKQRNMPEDMTKLIEDAK